MVRKVVQDLVFGVRKKKGPVCIMYRMMLFLFLKSIVEKYIYIIKKDILQAINNCSPFGRWNYESFSLPIFLYIV